MLRIALLAALAVAPAQDAALSALQHQDARLAAVVWRLQTANVALCTRVAPLAGLSVQTLDQYPPADRPRAAAQFGLDRHPGIAVVAPGSAAARAGLAPGDALLAIDGAATPVAGDGPARYDGAAATQTALEAALAHPPARLRIDRDGHARDIDLTGDPGCVSRAEIIPGRGLDARADGAVLQVVQAMAEFAASDDDLAAVAAHELAHNILGHRASLDAAHVSRGLFAGLGKNGQKLRDSEYAADRLSVWLVARAGYDVDAVAPFWARLGRATGGDFLSDGTHPGWKNRIVRIDAAVARLKAQRAAGAALIPPAQ